MDRFRGSLFLQCWVIALSIFLESQPLFAILKEFGIGDQGVAYPQSSATARYNPAGIIDVGNRLDNAFGVGYQNGYTAVEGSTNPSFNQRRSNSQAKWFPLALFGISRKLNDHISASLSADGTRTFKTSSKPGFAAFGTTSYGAEVNIPILLPTIAWKVNEQHSLGLSVPFVVGRLKVNGAQNIQADSVAPENVTNRGYSYACGWGLRFGWLWHVTPHLNFGFSYSTALINASHWHKYKGLTAEHALLQTSPLLRMGFSYRLNQRSHFSFEYFREFNKSLRTLANAIDSPAPFGSKFGPAYGWKDVAYYRFGFDYRLTKSLVVRAGDEIIAPGYINSANANGNTAPVLFVSQNIATCGATWEVKGWELDCFYQHCFSRKVKGQPAAAFAGGFVVIRHSVDAFMLGVGKKF